MKNNDKPKTTTQLWDWNFVHGKYSNSTSCVGPIGGLAAHCLGRAYSRQVLQILQPSGFPHFPGPQLDAAATTRKKRICGDMWIHLGKTW